MRPFEQAQVLLAGVEVPALVRAFGHAADLSLIVDDQGLIRDLAHAAATPPLPVDDWPGRRWADLVSPELRAKAADMLRDADQKPQWRQLNYDGVDPAWPAQCLVVRVSGTVFSLVFMRDLAPTSALQQRQSPGGPRPGGTRALTTGTSRPP